MLYLREDFQKYWAGKDPFQAADELEGQVFRAVKSRRTFRFEINGKGFFAKIHHGVGWAEILKNMVQFKKAIIGAGNEWAALNKLKELGVDTLTPCAFGQRGVNPANLDSFIITDELKNTVSLEDFCHNWKKTPPCPQLKHALIKKLAWVSSQMHSHGINHRDFYICHFLLDISGGPENLNPEHLKVFLIDLHRAQIRRQTPRRWIVKDVAGLWFSAMDIGLSKRDILRFISIYGKAMKLDHDFWEDVNQTAIRLYIKEFDTCPVCAV
jgi:heptose I phosphotransferase